MSSLQDSLLLATGNAVVSSSYASTDKLLLVAFSICSSRAVFADDDNQPIILTTMHSVRALRYTPT